MQTTTALTREDLEALEPEIILAVDWAREFLATEVEGQYTSDAALHLALVALARTTDAQPQGVRYA